MPPDFNIFQNLDLLSVGVAVAAIGILGFVVFINDRKSATGRSFLLFSLVTICWSIVNYAQYQIYSPSISFWILRLVVFFAVWHAFSFSLLAHVFPRHDVSFSRRYALIVLPAVALTAVLTLTPLVFSNIAEVSPEGRILRVANGPGIALFGLVVVALIINGIFSLFHKAKKAAGAERQQLKFVLLGMLLTFALLLLFNFILPAFFGNAGFIPLGPVFLLPFAFFTFYAIFKHNLLNIKVISTEIVAFFLVVVTFSEILLSSGLGETLFRVIVFAALLIISLLLIRSVLEEVRAREQISILAKDLEAANAELKKLDEAKSEFISIAGHQLRAPLTAIKGYSSMMLEGSFGAIGGSAREALNRIFISTDQVVKLVADLLDLSRIEAGRIRYEFKKMYFDDAVEKVIKELEQVSKEKGISIEFKNSNQRTFGVSGDADKLYEVVINLLDNALKYSKTGPITLALAPKSKRLLFSVEDKGIGIGQEDIGRLFTKFARADEAKKLRPDGMGLGLYFIKKIIEDHQGRVWVESPGIGKGSTFFVELPVA